MDFMDRNGRYGLKGKPLVWFLLFFLLAAPVFGQVRFGFSTQFPQLQGVGGQAPAPFSNPPGLENVGGIFAIWQASTLGALDSQVSEWPDVVSLVPKKLIQATSGSQPVVKAVDVFGSFTNTFLQFDGSNDKLQWLGTLNPPIHFFVVYTASDVAGPAWYLWDGGTARGAALRFVDKQRWYINAGTSTDPGVPNFPPKPQALIDTDWKLIEGYFDTGTSSYLKVAGQTILTGNAGNNHWGGITLGWSFNNAQTAIPAHVAFVLAATNEITGTNLTAVYNYIESQTHVWSRQGTVSNALNIVCHGDSLTLGVDSNLTAPGGVYDYSSLTYPQQLARRLYNLTHRDVTFVNAGVSGAPLGTTNAAAGINTITNYSPDNINFPNGNRLLVWFGTNDKATFSQSQAQLKASLDTYLDRAIAQGWLANGNEIIFGEMLPRGGISDSDQDDWNAYVNAQVSSNRLSRVARFSQIPLGGHGQNTNTAYYHADLIHLVQPGCKEVTGVWFGEVAANLP